MRKQLLLCILLLISLNISSQTIIDLTEASFRLEGISGEKVFYYGFSEGDQIIVNFQEKNGNTVKEFEIVELPSNTKFQEYKCTKIENKIVNVSRTGIYKFRLTNTALAGRICNLNIQRIAASEQSKDFNSTVYWTTKRDTMYIPKQKNYLIKSDTVTSEVYSSIVQISSSSALNGNLNRQLLNFQLPDNTIAWSFHLGVGDDAKSNFQNAVDEFTNNVSQMSTYFNPLTAVALKGIPLIVKNQGEDNVKYWFLDNQNAELFNYGQPFRYYKGGDIITETSQMKYPLGGKVNLGLVNDNSFEPISVYIKVVAVILIEDWGTRELKEMKITETEVPYLVN